VRGHWSRLSPISKKRITRYERQQARQKALCSTTAAPVENAFRIRSDRHGRRTRHQGRCDILLCYKRRLPLRQANVSLRCLCEHKKGDLRLSSSAPTSPTSSLCPCAESRPKLSGLRAHATTRCRQRSRESTEEGKTASSEDQGRVTRDECTRHNISTSWFDFPGFRPRAGRQRNVANNVAIIPHWKRRPDMAPYMGRHIWGSQSCELASCYH
jgi:hypothetical protein